MTDDDLVSRAFGSYESVFVDDSGVLGGVVEGVESVQVVVVRAVQF